MFDYEFTTMSRYDGTNGRMRAVEVFDTITGEVFSVVSHIPFEKTEAWVQRAIRTAEANKEGGHQVAA